MLQAWFTYIEWVHLEANDWHICVESFVFDIRDGLVELLTMMTDFNK
jgi:hypothetical protein